MKTGDIIRKHRKAQELTQEEMANRLGVTAPAVNKWENNITLPDVSLLAPIARLLGITTDELLSFKDELTVEEINQFVSQIQKDLEEKDYYDVFISAKAKIQEYPNCEILIWQTAVILDAWRMVRDIPNKEDYEDTILVWYDRCLHSENEQIRSQAADSMFHFYFRKEDYEKALQYTEYSSRENPERKRKEALVYSKTGRKEAAYRAYEELLFSWHQHIQMTLNDLRVLYMEDNDHEMANKLVSVSSAAAAAFEMGRYSEVCCGLDVAVWDKNVEKTAQIMQDILDSIGTIGDFRKSKLYQHMAFKAAGPEFTESLMKELLESLEDESYSYMRGNECWENLKASANDLC